MHLSTRKLLIGVSLCALAQGVVAVGFGKLPDSTTLGQPLELKIPLRVDAGEDLRPECLNGEVHFSDNLQQPGTTSLRLDPAEPSATERVLRLATTTRVDEPVVTVQITVGCASKVTRRFTLFADPPLIAPAEVAAPVAAVAPLAPPTPAASAASRPEAAPQDTPPMPRAATPRTPARSRAATAAPRRAPATAAAPIAAPRPAPQRAARPTATGNNARLKLAPLEAGALVAATPTPAEVAASAAAAEQAASAASAAALAEAARVRVEELEAAMNKLRLETATTQQAIAGLQARLQRAESDRYSNPLVYGLAAALAVLLGVVIWLWRQRNQERQSHAWLVQAATPAEAPRSGGVGAPAATAEAAAFAPVPTLKAWVSKPNEIDGFDDTLAATRAGSMSVTGALSEPAPLNAVRPLSAAQKREVSVEELIDLEQQAEFFIVLGQDAAAIDLLMGHLRSTSGTSPLPYLKLLEIYKRRGDRSDYERLRERFNSRFNAYAPAWETDLLGGRTLEDYPAVIEQLQALWSTPSRAMDVLQVSLLRPDDGNADPEGSDSFDLPAYRELMLLYSVARDRSELEAGGAVDLLLPIGASETMDDAPASAVFERLLATTSLEAQPEVQKPLEVDLSLEDLEPKPGEGGSGQDGGSRG